MTFAISKSLVPYESSSDSNSEDECSNIKRPRFSEADGIEHPYSSTTSVSFFGEGVEGCNTSERENVSQFENKSNQFEIPNTQFWKHKGRNEILDTSIPIIESPKAGSNEKFNKHFSKNSKSGGGNETATRHCQPLEVDGRRLYSSYQYNAQHNPVINCSLPSKISISVNYAHSKAARRAIWCPQPQYANLALSCSLDGSVFVWDLFSNSRVGQPAVCVQRSGPGVKACCWNSDGRRILTGGFGKEVQLWDVEKNTQIIKHYQTCDTNSLTFHPNDSNLYLAGGVDQLSSWDIRQKVPVKNYHYKNYMGQINDAVFLRHRSEFIVGCDVVSRNSSDRTIMIFDVTSGSVLSGQIFSERFTCTRFHLQPNDKEIFCQTQGDYIISLSTNPPYRVSSTKRLDGHHFVQGYPVGIHGSCDGRFLASASSDGSVVIYNSKTGHFLTKLMLGDSPTLDVNWHPFKKSTLISSRWDGTIHVLN